jgi:diguanylate cyclase (GGDEF)-like protein
MTATAKKTEMENISTSAFPLKRPAMDIRAKVLSVVVLSALAPALLVGFASYLTSREILIDKVNNQLTGRTASASEQVHYWFTERSLDTEVFANSFIVSENLRRWELAKRTTDKRAAGEAQSKLQEYLDQVRNRYPLYRELFIVDTHGTLVARTQPFIDELEKQISPELLLSERDNSLQRFGDELVFYVRRIVRDRQDEQVGTLVTISGLEELWRRLGGDLQQTDLGQIRIFDASGESIFDSRRRPPGLGQDFLSEGVRRCLAGEKGIAEYRDGRGREVLGAFQFLTSHRLGLIVEMDSEQAFAAVHRLRNFNLLISLCAASLVTLVGWGLVVSLTRPIEALIEGAKAVARGDLSQAIPISSTDEIGYLTKVFNRMTRALKETHTDLQQKSSTDELTGLFNRRFLAKAFNMELSRAERSGKPLSVLMVDIDHFKAFNDRFGHQEGDAVLRKTGPFLVEHLRSTDVAARYGGEEFIVLLPATGKKEAAGKAETLRKALAEGSLGGGRTTEVTVSIGVAVWPDDGRTEGELVGAADAALYVAKRGGRNRVAVSGVAASINEPHCHESTL